MMMMVMMMMFLVVLLGVLCRVQGSCVCVVCIAGVVCVVVVLFIARCGLGLRCGCYGDGVGADLAAKAAVAPVRPMVVVLLVGGARRGCGAVDVWKAACSDGREGVEAKAGKRGRLASIADATGLQGGRGKEGWKLF